MKIFLLPSATSCEELTHRKRLWCWEGLQAGGEGDDRGWDGWMASPTRWTWVWVNSGIWWWTGRPGVLWFMGSQRVGHDWATQLTDSPQKGAGGGIEFYQTFFCKNWGKSYDFSFSSINVVNFIEFLPLFLTTLLRWWMTYRKLYIFSICKSVSLGISLHPVKRWLPLWRP